MIGFPPTPSGFAIETVPSEFVSTLGTRSPVPVAADANPPAERSVRYVPVGRSWIGKAFAVCRRSCCRGSVDDPGENLRPGSDRATAETYATDGPRDGLPGDGRDGRVKGQREVETNVGVAEVDPGDDGGHVMFDVPTTRIAGTPPMPSMSMLPGPRAYRADGAPQPLRRW